MSKALIKLMACVCLFWGARTLADGTNFIGSQVSTDEVNAFLQIQAQLHETQMAIESNRMQTVAALGQNADNVAASLQGLEQNLTSEAALSQNAAASSQRVEQAIFIVGGFGILVLAAVVTMVFLQLRTTTRLIELAISSPAAPLGGGRAMPVVETSAALSASARAAIESSNTRLLGMVDRLERRILDLEQTARTPLEDNTPSPGMAMESPTERRVTDLVVEGQLFLDTNKPEKALSCFDAALKVRPNLADALIKKAAALEKLERMNDALACYDQAIETEEFATTALLQKGGLLNRLARYEEALHCYERALQTQERKTATAA